MAEATAEEPTSKKGESGKGDKMAERGLNKRISRRAALGLGAGAAAAGGLAFLEWQTGAIGILGRGVGETGKIAQPLVIDQLRGKIDGLRLHVTQKEKLVKLLDGYEATYKVINQYIAEYEARKDSDGSPTLYNEIRKRLPFDLDIMIQDPRWRGEYASGKEFLEQRFLFFLGDKKFLDDGLRQAKEIALSPPVARGQENQQAEEAWAKKVYQAITLDGLGSNKVDEYAQVDTDRSSRVEIEELPFADQFAPKNTPIWSKSRLQIVEEVANELPTFGPVKLTIAPSQRPAGSTGPPGYGFTRSTEDGRLEAVLDGGRVSEWGFKRHVAHETIHLMDLLGPRELKKWLRPNESIDLLIRYYKMLNDERIGFNFREEVFTEEMADGYNYKTDFRKPSLTAKLFKAATSIDPARYWVGQTEDLDGPLQQRIFERYLDRKLLESFAANSSRGHFVADLQTGVEANPDRFTQLAQSSLRWQKAVALIREKAKNLPVGNGWADIGGVPVGSRRENVWWLQVVPCWANYFLMRSYVNGDRSVIDLFSPEEQAAINSEILTLVERIDKEKTAEMIGVYIASGGQSSSDLAVVGDFIHQAKSAVTDKVVVVSSRTKSN